ncbi:MAG TPA: GNAT family N-acetyltransferase [Flavobacteriaceae bacterium]|nr:GNAT family N-acetyltransferase [Flavobacteriaceae bacterium]
MEKKLQQADENLRESIRLQINAVPGAQLVEDSNYIIYSIGEKSTDPHLNGALCLNDDYAEEMLERANVFFEDLNLDYTIWVRDHADFKLEELLKKSGWKPSRIPGSAVMIIEEKIKKAELPKGFKVEKVIDRYHINDFGKVVKQAFDKTRPLINQMLKTEETLIDDNIIAYVVYEENIPVSAVMTVFSEDTAGIYWVATVEQARGKGLGSFVTQIATNMSFDRGKSLVILQASELGEGVYKKLGFQTITRYRTYTVSLSI